MKQKYDVIVIGAGIAGMTAAIYLKRYGYEVLVIEKNYPGGQLNKIGTIENYPGFKQVKGPDLAVSLYEQVQSLEIPFLFTNVEKIDVEKKEIETTNDIFYAEAIVLATGRNPRKLGLELEEELIGRGGNSAIGEALFLASLCKKVYIIHRKDTFRASQNLIEKVKQLSNIEIYYDSVVTSLKQEDGKLASIVVTQKEMEKQIPMDGLFVYIGMEPSKIAIQDPSFYTEDGYIAVNGNMETNINGIYACGDAIQKEVYQLTTSIGEATCAAFHIHKNRIEKEKNV